MRVECLQLSWINRESLVWEATSAALLAPALIPCLALLSTLPPPCARSLRAKLSHAFDLLRTYQHKVRVLDATVALTGTASAPASRPVTPLGGTAAAHQHQQHQQRQQQHQQLLLALQR